MDKAEKSLSVVLGNDLVAEYKKNSVRPEFLALIVICMAAIEKSNGRLSFVKIKNDHEIIFTNLKEPITKNYDLHLLLDDIEESGVSLEFIESNGVFIGWDVAFGFMFRIFLSLKYEIPESFEVAKKMMLDLCEKYNIKQNFEALEKNFSPGKSFKKEIKEICFFKQALETS